MKSSHNYILFFLLTLLDLTILAANAASSEPQCFVSGECVESFHIDIARAEDEFQCLDLCKQNANCTWFTFYPESKLCNLLENCQQLDDSFCPSCISGQEECQKPEPVCWVTGECMGTILRIEQNVKSKETCLHLCQSADRCKWFTYMKALSACLLMLDCQTIDETCADCISGEKLCQEEDAEWHMIFGGRGGQADKELKVELFNWRTGEQCQLSEQLPFSTYGHSAAVLDGVPVYCGGLLDKDDDGDKRCHKFLKETKTWEQIADVNAGSLYYASGVVVPSTGWVIFGGASGNETTASLLSSVESSWQDGPDLFENRTDYFNCIVQINDTVTAFIGGFRDPFRIVTFDWQTMEYTLHSIQFQVGRRLSTCAKLKGHGGEDLIAVAGGDLLPSGMEVWNPKNGSTAILTSNFPETYNSGFPQMISVNHGRDLVYYEQLGKQNDIFMYHGSNNSWSLIGKLIEERDYFTALPVLDIKC